MAMSIRLTDEEMARVRRQAEEASDWLRSEEGKRSMREALERCRERIRELRRQRRIPPGRLDEPLEIP